MLNPSWHHTTLNLTTDAEAAQIQFSLIAMPLMNDLISPDVMYLIGKFKTAHSVFEVALLK
jgi:hypothetical protein